MQPKSVFLKPGILPPIRFTDSVSKIISAGLALQWRNYLTRRIAPRSMRVRFRNDNNNMAGSSLLLAPRDDEANGSLVDL